jgi:hypothetical protein
MSTIAHYSTQSTKSTKEELTCEYCNKTFARLFTLERHKHKFCKENKVLALNNVLEKKDEIIMELFKKIEERDKKIDEKDREMKTMMEQMVEMSNNIGNNITNITQNNTQNNTQNINIVPYGQENLDHITSEHVEKLLNNPVRAIANMVYCAHFDQKKPENMNYKITNIHDSYAHEYDGDIWKAKDKNKSLSRMIMNKYKFIDDMINDDESDEKVVKKKKVVRNLISCNKDVVVSSLKEVVINGTKRCHLKKGEINKIME